jgi:hypothetical protein
MGRLEAEWTPGRAEEEEENSHTTKWMGCILLSSVAMPCELLFVETTGTFAISKTLDAQGGT